MSERRGVVYLAVLIVSVVGLIAGLAYHQMMQVGRRQAYRSLTGEYAGMMARTGLSLAQAYLARSMRQESSRLHRFLSRPLADLMGAGPVVDAGFDVDLKTEFPTLTREMAKDLPDGDRSLKLTARYYLLTDHLRPLPSLPLGDRTWERAGPEKMGRLYVTVDVAVANPSLGQDVERRVRAYHEFRVAHAPVPLVSDFTLYAQKKVDQSGVEANEVGITSGNDGVPIVLNNGVAKVQRQAGQDLSPDFFKKQGWVFLGGGPLTLNLTYSMRETAGDRSIGEDFHFYQINPTNRRAGRTVSDKDAATVQRANRHLSGTTFWDIRYWDMGVHSLASGPLKDEYEDVFTGIPADQKRGSLLKLYGAAPDRVSPTVVLGDVQAGFLRLVMAAPLSNPNRAFDAFLTVLVHKPKNQGGFLSGFLTQLLKYLGKFLFNPDIKMSGKWAFYKPDLSNSLLPPGSAGKEEDYKELCSGYRTRNYNRALLHLKAENKMANPAAKQADLGLPDAVVSDGALPADRSKLPAEILPPDLSALAGLDLAAVDLAALIDPLSKTASMKVPDGQDLGTFLTEQGMLEGGVLDLGTVLRADGAVTIPAVSAIRRGGVILARSITVQGAVVAGPAPGTGAPAPQRTLVLIATEGAIQLPVDAKVDASLIALKGAVAPQGDFEVSGNIVGNRLDLDALATGVGAAELKYDPGLKQRVSEAAAAAQLVVDWSRRAIRVD